MAIPDKITISRIEDYHTHYLGRYGDGSQFMSFVVATLPEIFPQDWQRHKRWYAVLHTFDADGNHLGTEARLAGVTADGQAQVWERAGMWQDEMIAALGQAEWSDIAVRLFSVQVDGQTFGLVDSSFRSEEGVFYEEATLQPNDFVFSEPWDGDYDT